MTGALDYAPLSAEQRAAAAGAVDADGSRLLWPLPADAPEMTQGKAKAFAPDGYGYAAHWCYRDAAGRLLGYAVRYDKAGDGTEADKQFRPLTCWERPDGRREWRAKGFPGPCPLYGLDRLAARPGAPVIVCEGEKSADAATRLFPEHVAVTSPNGAKAAGKADWGPLRSRALTIWPDADAPGALYAVDVARLAGAAGAASVAVVEPSPYLPDGWDLADTVPDGLDLDPARLVAEAAGAVEADGPLPLFPDLPPAGPYPVEALGPVLGRAANAIAHKIQVPAAMASQSVLATAALAAQAHADVTLPYGQVRPVSLFFVTVAASGDRKSSADNEALWPVKKHEAALRERHAAAMKDWLIADAAWTAQKRKIEGDGKLDLAGRKQRLVELGNEPLRPLAAFLTTGDLTVEGLTKNWGDLLPALGIFTNEGGTFTGGHAMSDDNRLKTAAMLSEVWDGKPVKRVRALDGVTILPGRRLSLHLMVQPDAAAGFLGNGTLRDQGMLSRVLAAAPATLAGTRFHSEPDPADDAAIRAYGDRILSLLEAPLPLANGTRNELEPRALALDADAKAELVAFADHVEREIGTPDSLNSVRDLAAKAAEHAARIAGVLTIVADRGAATIGRDAMAAAVALADWYVNEALRLHHAGRRDPKLVRAQALLDWLRERGGAGVMVRDVLRLGPAATRTKAAAEEALAVLKGHGWVVEASRRPRAFRLTTGATS